ncbi:MAG TPA: DNA-3-methyladenine glycosylase [Dermatophilaceae bacterium]|jgi:DNA-3-methyladenine glycosylase
MAGQRDPRPDRLTRAFFARPVLEVAPELLGCTVACAGVTLRLTEVEAYDGSNDPGSHAFRGQTPRTAVMFGEPGGLYVYFTYGMHWCANFVCGPVGAASAVLLRAGEVVGGLEVARARRAGVADRDLARGPARLAMTLALTGDQNGIDTVTPDSALVIRRAVPGPDSDLSGPLVLSDLSGPVVRTGPRVGVSGRGGDGTAYPWRFWLEGEATVSAYRSGTARSPKPANRPGDP